jgi:signal transduction histidine kinase
MSKTRLLAIVFTLESLLFLAVFSAGLYLWTLTPTATASRPWGALLIFLIMAYFALQFMLCRRLINRPQTCNALLVKAAKRAQLGLNPELISSESVHDNELIDAYNLMQQQINQLLSERTCMLAAISHDLRSPITRMKLRTEHYLDDTMQKKFMGDLDEMEYLSNQVLRFAQSDTQTNPKESIDIIALTHEIAHNLVGLGATVHLQSTRDELHINVDRVSIKRALSNLISNACKYGDKAHIEVVVNDKVLNIHITDEGPGIPADELEKVFLPYYRVESSRSQKTGGHGLGLIIARRAALAHNGAITLKNIKPYGLCATLALPLIQKEG